MALLILLSAANAQSSYNINISHGLLTNAITDITRDRNNNMWIGTYNGLYKHEGAYIKKFITTGKGPADLSGPEMHTVYEDRLGFIWAGTTNGLDKINPYTYEVTHYPIRNKDSNSSFVGYIYALFQDDEDFIWICTDAAMFRMNYQTGEYIAIPESKTHTGMPAYAVNYNCGVKTGKGIWMHSLDGMVYYEYASKKFYHRYHNPEKKAVFDIIGTDDRLSQSGMETDNKGNIWFLAKTGLLAKYNWRTNALDTFSFQHPEGAWYCCYSVKADDRGNIWLGFRLGGLVLFDVQAKTFTSIRRKERNSLISSNYIYSLEKDYRGNIWVATDNGIDVIDYYNRSVQVRQLSTRPDFLNLQYQSGDASFDGKQHLYFPFSRFGFLRYDIEKDSVQEFGAGNESTNRGAAYVIPVNDNTVWAAREKKLVLVNLKTGHSTNTDYSSVLPRSIEKTGGNLVWYRKTNTGSFFVKKNNGDLLIIRGDSVSVVEGYGFKKNATASADGQSIWYLTGSLNLHRIDVHTGKTDTILLQQQLKGVDFSFSNPRDMTDDGESIWMTGQNGLLRYNYVTNTLRTYTLKQGLSHPSTYSLVTDEKRRVWAASIGGIDVYNKASDLFMPVASFPVSTYQDAFGSALKITNGRLAFHAGNKVYIISPEDHLAEKKQVYPLLLQEVQVNEMQVDISDVKKLTGLKHYQNKLMVRFGLLMFQTNQRIDYWYKLHEKDAWVRHENNTPLILNELQPGHYNLYVKATTASGDVLAENKIISFGITPPWWKRWWFRVIIVAVLALALLLLYRRRVKAIKDKAAIKQQMTELESKALRAQMNPHFIFNSLNAIQELIVTKNIDEGYQYLSQFSKLLRMVLNNSEKNLIRLSAELEMIRLQLSLESLRFRNSFNYSIQVDENVEPEVTNIPPLLLQPYVENAVWHGLRHKKGERNLRINVQEVNSMLRIIIEDDGIGRQRAEEIKKQKLGTEQFESKGSTLSGQRIQLLNQHNRQMATIEYIDMKDEANKVTGTKVIINLPPDLKSA